jgi:TonB-dependent SusC/RagA subfamily outer membrane receptor
MSAFANTIAGWAPFLAAWMATTLIVSAVLTGVALLLHRLARGVAPSRVVWSVALFTAVALAGTQPWRRAAPSIVVGFPLRVSTTATGAPAAAPSLTDRFLNAARTASVRADAAMMQASSGLSRVVARAPLTVKLVLVLAWPLATVVLVGIGAWTYRRQRRLLRAAQPTALGQHSVFVCGTAGPAVYGVRSPRIVVPAWLLHRSPEEQQFVLTHEQAHITARDPMLLMSACAAAALVPWNPCMWYLLNRLRLAIELDCDTRVLQSGASARRYGALLIDLSAAATPAPLLTGATAFSHHTSHLERRLRRMTDRPVAHTTTRRLVSLSLGALALIAACGAELPTSAELEGMDVTAAQQRTAALAPALGTTRFVIDGKEVTEAEAKALNANRIASINISKLDKKTSELRIATRSAGDSTAGAVTTLKRVEGFRIAVKADGTADSSRTLVIGENVRMSPAKSTFEGLIFVDGVKATEEAMKMSPDRIQSIEVIKGAAAEKIYGPEGAKGVIRITTKK